MGSQNHYLEAHLFPVILTISVKSKSTCLLQGYKIAIISAHQLGHHMWAGIGGLFPTPTCKFKKGSPKVLLKFKCLPAQDSQWQKLSKHCKSCCSPMTDSMPYTKHVDDCKELGLPTGLGHTLPATFPMGFTMKPQILINWCNFTVLVWQNQTNFLSAWFWFSD